MKLTRRVTFSSGHRYWIDGRSEDENRKLFGGWASKFNHGHNYILEVTVTGPINEATGMVVNIKDIDDVLQKEVVSRYNQRSLNDEIEEFNNVATSCENIAIAIWRSVGPKLPEGVTLASIRLFETPELWVEYEGNTDMLLTRSYEFAASHRLHVPAMPPSQNVELFGKCNNEAGHGHNYILEVTVRGTPDPVTGMSADIEEIDRIVHDEVVDRYDHKHLNVDIEEFREANPTTEVVTRTIWQRLKAKLPALEKVVVRETARNIFEYAGEDE